MLYLFLLFLEVKISWFIHQFSIIELNFYVNSSTNIILFPLQSSFYTEAGETTLFFFRLINISNENLSLITTYTIFPYVASIYINKLQCFCFEMIHIKSKEQLDLPVVFFLSNSLKTDLPFLKKIIFFYDLHNY